MSMYLTDEMLAQAAKNVGETMLASLPDPEDREEAPHSSVPAESCRSSPCIGGWAERLDGG